MRRRITRLVTILVVLGVVVFGCSLFYGWLSTGHITFSNAGNYTYIAIDGEVITPDSLKSGVNLSRGEHQISASGPFAVPFDETIKVGFRDTQELALSSDIRDAKTILEELNGLAIANGFAVGNYELFETNTWMVADVYDPAGMREGAVNIYQFKDGIWQVATSGTGIVTDDYSSNTLPNSINRYLEEGE